MSLSITYKTVKKEKCFGDLKPGDCFFYAKNNILIKIDKVLDTYFNTLRLSTGDLYFIADSAIVESADAHIIVDN
jgi:hypothetical protein